MTGRRFEIGYSHQVFFVDRLRLGCFCRPQPREPRGLRGRP